MYDQIKYSKYQTVDHGHDEDHDDDDDDGDDVFEDAWIEEYFVETEGHINIHPDA